MIQRQLKLRLSRKQETTLYEWLPMLTSIWNWSIRKIENDAQGGIYHTPKDFQNILPGTSKTLGMPSHTIQGMLSLAHTSWQRCFRRFARKPRLKGMRNRLNSIPFPDPIGHHQTTRSKCRDLAWFAITNRISQKARSSAVESSNGLQAGIFAYS